MSCNPGTAQRENFVPVSYCRAIQEYRMVVEPKPATSCVRYFFERLRIACTKMFTAKLMDVSGLWDLNEKKVEELHNLLVFVWSPRSEGWPR